LAFSAASASTEAMVMRPVSSTSILALVRATMRLMTLPPGPMTSPTF
jgi:hypothetical protein